MFFNEIYNYKILELVINNKCDLSNLSLLKIDDNLFTQLSHIDSNKFMN